MRVFIHYAPKHARDSFEGTRLRKTIKGACELVDIEWVDFSSVSCDVAHFISPLDYPLLRQKKNEGTPCVVSCVYAEREKRASFFEENILGDIYLNRRSRKILQATDLILVPSNNIKEILESSGITTKIEVVEPAVRLDRFDEATTEKEIFLRYFRIHNGTKTVVATGSYSDKTSVNLMKKLANLCPNIEFYFFGSSSTIDPLNLIKMARNFHRGPNLHFCSLVQDDIYRSAMTSSIAYVECPSAKPDSMVLLEAFAARCQVVGLQPKKPNPLLVDGLTAKLFDNAEDMGSYLLDLAAGKAKDTLEEAYMQAKGRSLYNLGKDLKDVYQRLTDVK